MPSVDVAIPCYQYGRFLRDCVTSVLSQGVDDLRVLIIDNASTDDSVDVARQLAREDRRVQVSEHARNRGPHASYNEGVDWAAADYFLLLDADDLLAPGALRRAMDLMEQRPDVCMTHGAQPYLDPDLSVRVLGGFEDPESWTIQSGEDFIRRICRLPINPVGSPTVIRRTSAQKQAGFYRESLPYTDDFELWLRLAMLGGVARTGAIQAVRRLHPAQHGVTFEFRVARDFEEREAAFESFFAHEGAALPDAPALMARARRGLAEQAYWSAVSQLAQGRGRVGAGRMRYAISRNPRSAVLPPLGWLARDGVWSRAGEVIAQATRRSRRSAARKALSLEDCGFPPAGLSTASQSG